MIINYIVLIKRVSIPFIVGLSFLFYRFFPKAKQDNPVEEIAEEWINVYVGKDIDLSPSSAEALACVPKLEERRSAGRPETVEIKEV